MLLALTFCGCTPKGPRDLLAGKKLIDKARYADAIERLTNAVAIMPTNAQAWNYLGLAYHYSGRSPDAEAAYHRALRLDQDLSEARYNLGCLLLEENRPDMARSELTAFTLRRGNSEEGLLKLGEALLGSRDQAALASADKAFQEVLRLNPTNVEALNGVGMTRFHQRRYNDAKQCFSSALRLRPNFAPAMLNLAIVEQTRMQDYGGALKYFRQYVSLTPTPPNADAVLAVANELEERLRPAPAPAPPNSQATRATTQAVPAASSHIAETKPRVASNSAFGAHAGQGTGTAKPVQPAVAETSFATTTAHLSNVATKASAVNHPEAEREFQRGLEFQRAHRIPDAIVAYQSAVRYDPSYFEAYYNMAAAAAEGGSFQMASNAYHHALTIRPDSLDAMYNLALLLKDNGRYGESAAQLEQLLAKYPNESRAQLAMANLCAQQLHDDARARLHYSKVLETDPHNPQANDIRHWIAEHR